MFKIFFNIKKKLNEYLVIKKFIEHNKKKFIKKNKIKKKNQILVEFNAFHPSHIAISYLCNVLKINKNSEISAFFNYSIISTDLEQNYLNKLKWKIGNFFSLNNFGIYKSFGVNNIFKPIINDKIISHSEKIFSEIISEIKNKNDVLNIKLDGMLFGDLIYDTYLKSYKKKTLDINDNLFKKLLLDFLKLYFFWKEYLSNNKIDAIMGVHTVYSYAIPLRVAINKNIPAYFINPQAIYKLDKKMMRMYGDFYNYPENFLKLPKRLQIKGKTEAKKRLEKRLSGIAGIEVDLLTAVNSAFLEKKNHKPIIKKTPKKKY